MIKKINILYEAIKFEHTIFALPFAYLGMVLAAHGLPTLWQIFWITLAMVGARSFAMATNRLVDASQDALNPRTANRALPKRLLKPIEMLLFALVALALSALMHILTIALLLIVGILLHLGLIYWLGLAIATGLIIYEHQLVSSTDLSKVNVAFFNMNGYIALVVFLSTFLAIYIRFP